MIIPRDFQKKIIEMHQEKGHEWLQELQCVLDDFETQTGAALLEPFPISYHLAAPAVMENGSHAVFKIGFPSSEYLLELDAINDFAGGPIASLIDADREKGWMLMEQLQPGFPLSSLEDEEQAVSHTARILEGLWRPVPHARHYPSVNRLAAGFINLRSAFHGETGPLPSKLVEKAERLFTELLDSSQDNLLLHGDLHHGNILFDQKKGWTAIDAKGIIGEKAYDCIPFLKNHLLTRENPGDLLEMRIQLFSQRLNIDAARIAQMGFCQSVLSAWWSVEDHEDWKWGIRCAELFQLFLP